MVYTSRYANRALADSRFYKVAISRGLPKFALGYEIAEQCYMFAPGADAWGVSDERFLQLYEEKLDRTGVGKVKWMIEKLIDNAAGKDVVLLCFEDVRDPDQLCHRTVLAEWLNENLALGVEELDDPSEVKYKNKARKRQAEEERLKEEYEQLTLFS